MRKTGKARTARAPPALQQEEKSLTSTRCCCCISSLYLHNALVFCFWITFLLILGADLYCYFKQKDVLESVPTSTQPGATQPSERQVSGDTHQLYWQSPEKSKMSKMSKMSKDE